MRAEESFRTVLFPVLATRVYSVAKPSSPRRSHDSPSDEVPPRHVPFVKAFSLKARPEMSALQFVLGSASRNATRLTRRNLLGEKPITIAVELRPRASNPMPTSRPAVTSPTTYASFRLRNSVLSILKCFHWHPGASRLISFGSHSFRLAHSSPLNNPYAYLRS